MKDAASKKDWSRAEQYYYQAVDVFPEGTHQFYPIRRPLPLGRLPPAGFGVHILKFLSRVEVEAGPLSFNNYSCCSSCLRSLLKLQACCMLHCALPGGLVSSQLD